MALVKLLATLVLCVTSSYRLMSCVFCEEPNLLSQWRTYGQSGGYSIGLDKDALGHLHTQSDVFSVELKKVIYQKHHQEKILQGVIDDSVQGFENEKIKGKFKDLTPAAKDYCVRMSEFLLQRLALNQAVRFKHPAFEEEREWRLIAQPRPIAQPMSQKDQRKALDEVEFRTSRGIPAPYIQLLPKEDVLPITSIRYGPTLEGMRVGHALDILLKKHGYANVQIEGSEIPVRI